MKKLNLKAWILISVVAVVLIVGLTIGGFYLFAKGPRGVYSRDILTVEYSMKFTSKKVYALTDGNIRETHYWKLEDDYIYIWDLDADEETAIKWMKYNSKDDIVILDAGLFTLEFTKK